MNIQTEDYMYEITYEDNHYIDMQFKRLDWINGVCYVTFQQMITRKWFTFEQNKLHLALAMERKLVS
ncbi:hypothetical protein [Niallia nealsonii]|uniref:Uncharacterized protein n=1 Tax=Niallia nealsonii TaxID=115979 RepID=A0A2N0YYU5_9BACI|nr:hypothetical protein [Niallia nealsonii]PKG22437.1 hypothetical protein CWS01_17670 [Niallia nealsonii]